MSRARSIWPSGWERKRNNFDLGHRSLACPPAGAIAAIWQSPRPSALSQTNKRIANNVL